METTGLEPEEDEIIRLVILEDEGTICFDSFFYPQDKFDNLIRSVEYIANSEAEKKEIWNKALNGELEDIDSDWYEAFDYNGIAPRKLLNAPLFADQKHKLTKILKGKDVIVFNAKFVTKFLEKDLFKHANTFVDCMEDFGFLYNRYREIDVREFIDMPDYYSLQEAIYHVNQNFKYDPCNSLNKVEALKLVWHYLYKNYSDDIERFGLYSFL